MRIGIVESSNARPLTWGFEKNREHELITDSPKNLSRMLLEGKLDTALISSVEIIRNKDILSYSTACGVCTRDIVRSILFFQNKDDIHPLNFIQVDSGSKTSVALFELLYNRKYKTRIQTVSTDPLLIKKDIQIGKGSHLLFGDNALSVSWHSDHYEIVDLAHWWYQETGLNFIFALWAFPNFLVLEDEFFLNSLRFGMDHIEDIVKEEQKKGKLPHDAASLKKYLTKDLQYIPDGKNWQGLDLFEKLLRESNLL